MGSYRDQVTSVLVIRFTLRGECFPLCSSCFRKEIRGAPARIKNLHQSLVKDPHAFIQERYQLTETPTEIQAVMYENGSVIRSYWE